MKHFSSVLFFTVLWVLHAPLYAQKDYSSIPSVGNSGTSNNHTGGKQLFIDVHHLPPGKITVEGVAAAHAKDLATEGKYGVQFLNYWVDTAKGAVYCLSLASDSGDIVKTHALAHGLLPDQIYAVQGGNEAALLGGKNLYLDVHELGAGHVKAADVAAVHLKDLAVQGKYGVNLINYWVNEKDGVVMCLAEAPDSGALIKTHKEAHGLLPNRVYEVKQGQ